MAIINTSNSFIFIHIPKTGGTSVSRYYSALSTPIDIEIGATSFGEALQPHYRQRFGIGKHCTARGMKEALGAETYNRYWTFCFSRNPFTRTISIFTFLKEWLPRAASKGNEQAGQHWKKFQRFHSVMDMLDSPYWHETDGIDRIFKPQSFWACDDDGKVLVDFVGAIETIEEDVGRINRRLRLKLPRFDINKNVSNKHDQALDIDDHGIELIQDRYAADFSLFGYSMTPDR
jgi:hypothetical protein